MWSYCSANGKLSHDEVFVGIGYSGIGPLPRGSYIIDPFFDDPDGKGPIVAHLTPLPQTSTFGRSGFMIHGDNCAQNHTASHGCIILAHNLRQQIEVSNDNALEVV